MIPIKVRPKPTTSRFDAIQWTGSNLKEMSAFLVDAKGTCVLAGPHPQIGDKTESKLCLTVGPDFERTIKQGDWVVRNSEGKFVVRSDEAFKMAYEQV